MSTPRRPDVDRKIVCDWCGEPLSGKQRRYCDRICKARVSARKDRVSVTPDEKMCGRCRVVKSASEFAKWRRHATGLQGQCRSCFRAARRAAKYGLTLEDLMSMLERQGWRCAICPDAIDEPSAHVDHDHRTGLVRALLCSWCNRGLGHFKDDAELLLAAATYLERHSS